MLRLSKSFDEAEKERAKADAHEMHLIAEFKSNDHVGQAFRKMCSVGCDPEWLKRELLRLRLHPFTRPKKSFTPKDVLRVKRMIKQFERLARAYGKAQYFVFLGATDKWNTHPQDVPDLLTGIAKDLQASLGEGNRWQHMVHMTAAFVLPHLITQIEEKTGRPHYAVMATLIGAAYNRPYFSETQLKNYVKRNRLRLRLKQNRK